MPHLPAPKEFFGPVGRESLKTQKISVLHSLVALLDDGNAHNGCQKWTIIKYSQKSFEK